MDNNINVVFQFVQANTTIENLFLHERLLGSEGNKFAIFSCASIKRAYNYSETLKYHFVIDFYGDDLLKVQSEAGKAKDLIINFQTHQIEGTRFADEMKFIALEFSKGKYKSQSIHQAKFEFFVIM